MCVILKVSLRLSEIPHPLRNCLRKIDLIQKKKKKKRDIGERERLPFSEE